MTLEETQKVIAYITAAYPRYYANVTRDSAVNMITVWNDTFADYSVQAVMIGVKGYISADGSGFPPSPGQIIEYIHFVGNPKDHSGTEAWALVRRAVNVPWDQFEASFATLPRTVQIAVGSAASLKEMAQMDSHQFETVAQSNFLRMYDTAQRREKTEDRMGNAVIGARQNIALELQKRAERRNPDMIAQRSTPPMVEAKTETPPTPLAQADRTEAPSDRLAALRARLSR